jgi:hypothetical protein
MCPAAQFVCDDSSLPSCVTPDKFVSGIPPPPPPRGLFFFGLSYFVVFFFFIFSSKKEEQALVDLFLFQILFLGSVSHSGSSPP